MKYDIELKMPDSLARCHEDDFEEIFLDELQQQSDALPLQDFTAEAGWPDEDTLQLEIDAIMRGSDRVVVTFSFKFDEVLSTGCADIQRNESAFGKPEAVLDLREEHDGYSLLICADGERLFYSGDFRGHGRKAALFDRFTRDGAGLPSSS